MTARTGHPHGRGQSKHGLWAAIGHLESRIAIYGRMVPWPRLIDSLKRELRELRARLH